MRTLAILCLVLTNLCLGCASVTPQPAVERIDVPKTLLSSNAVAYRVTGKSSRLTDVRLPLPPELRKDADARHLLLAVSNGRYWPVAHRMDGDAIVANLAPGDYVLGVQPAISIGRAMDILCHVQGLTVDKSTSVRNTFLPKICTQILCGNTFMTEKDFVAQYPELGLDGVAPGGIGGWTTPPGDICATCTMTGRWTADFTLPTIQCVSRAGDPGCSGATVLFNDNFEADTVGAIPTTPAGAPPDDSVATTGSVLVTNSAALGSKAAHLARGGLAGVNFNAVLGSGATTTGTYCITFRVAIEAGAAALDMSLRSVTGQVAWNLYLGDDGWQLYAGGTPINLPGSLVGSAAHRVRFDVDLNIRRFNLVIDGTTIAAGVPFQNSAFATPALVRFHYYPTYLEALPGRADVDDVQVRRN